MSLPKIFIALSFMLIACWSSAQSVDFVGSWRLDINKSIARMSPQFKNRYDTLKYEVKDRAVDRMNGREFIFFSDGNITVNWKSNQGPQISKGNWLIDESGKNLSVTIDDREINYSYEFLSSDVLVIKPTRQFGFFDALYLLRNH